MVRRHAPQIALSVVSAFVLCGSRSNCDTRTPTLTCAPLTIALNPGQCSTFTNPCDTQWDNQDGFKLCDEPAGLTITTSRARGVITRQICASPTMTPVANLNVAYLYSQTDDFGEGTILVTVGTPMTAVATANPTTVAPGNGTQLGVTITGGVGPFTYSWAPGNLVSDPSIANPMAFPVVDTTFMVMVNDSAGGSASASVLVMVSSALVVTAAPSTINVGQLSQLNAMLQGGVPPFTYTWSPNVALTSATSPNPIAFPQTTTTYTVVVTDGSAGSPYTGSVTLTVNLQGQAVANPSVVLAGGSSQLDVGVAGGAPPYTYTWADPTGTLSDTNIRNPVAMPLVTTTYNVTVRDLTGQSITRPITVTVNGATLSACFTTVPTSPVSPTAVTIDMSCSGGAITQYTMWLFYAPGATPTYVGTLPTYQTFTEAPTTYNVRVMVEDAAGNTASFEAPVVVQ